ncbi:hypothetical protein AB9K41_10450 [Cribrihabitans sp. XS_ASV171]
MLWFPLFVLLACNTPSPHFSGVEATRIVIEGSLFDVRVRGNLAESIRLSPERDARFAVIGPRAGRAMERAAGCNVLQVQGDSALQLGVLGCDRDAGERLLQAARASPDYDCFETSAWSAGGENPHYRDYDCTPN